LFVAAAPGLISDSACARSLVAAKRVRSAAAARPKNLDKNPDENLGENRDEARKEYRNG
jgi:hypothetical protein